jgi:alanyl-tRNA synthetase
MTTNPNIHKFDPKWLAKKAFDLYQSSGVPIEVSEDLIEKEGYKLDIDELNKLIENHQKLSQSASNGQFKSGVGTDSNKGKIMHTTTHILHSVLRDVFGNEIKQMGSAILDDKARFDTNIDKNLLTEEKINTVREKVQNIINKKLDMTKTETIESDARKMGAIGLFGEKYADKVIIYKLEDKNTNIVYSMEFCGGPHVMNTAEIGNFKILKVKSIGNSLSRIEFDVI